MKEKKNFEKKKRETKKNDKEGRRSANRSAGTDRIRPISPIYRVGNRVFSNGPPVKAKKKRAVKSFFFEKSSSNFLVSIVSLRVLAFDGRVPVGNGIRLGYRVVYRVFRCDSDVPRRSTARYRVST